MPRGTRRRPLAPRPAGPGPRFRAVHNESAQTQVHILFHALPETDPGYLALRALVRVLDDGMSTRLHYQICDQKGLAYSVAGTLHSYHDAALLEVDAACAHAKLPALVSETLAMLGRFREELVGEDELEKAKRRFVSDVESSYDDLDGLCGWFGGTELYCKADSQEKRARALARVRPADVREVARRVLRPERLSVTAVGMLGPGAVAQGREDRRRLRVAIHRTLKGPRPPRGLERARVPARVRARGVRLMLALAPRDLVRRFFLLLPAAGRRGGRGRRDVDGQRQRLLHRLAGRLLADDEARLGADRLLARLGRRDGDVEARAVHRARREIGARPASPSRPTARRARVSATVMGASAFTCQPPFALIVTLAVAVPPTATLGSVFVTS